LLPPEAHGQWRLPWETGWRDSGTAADNLVPGDYPIEFRVLPDWLTIPANLPVQVTEGGTTVVSADVYYPTINAGDQASGSGSLTVDLGLTAPDGAAWGFLGDPNPPSLASGYSTNLLAGTYLINFAAVGGRITPQSEAVQVRAGLPSRISVNYLVAQSPPLEALLPTLVPADSVADITNFPFGFNGQLQSEVGYGSGVAVLTNVVLTAAHLVFNDQSLSYVSEATWFLQKEGAVLGAKPQQARGWYVLSGYASQRTNDLLSGLYGPDQSTPQSRNVDVAALYFPIPVAQGGHGGYLPSDTVSNIWLTGTSPKMIVGYPVDGSLFGDDTINANAGKMYQTLPRPYSFSLAADPVSGQQVYTAKWFLSYSGNSGGPVYVELNGYYYPAAVYLGSLYNGVQPYASVVRAIDSNVVNLINLAQTQGDAGTNNTGGGVLTIIPSQAIAAENPGYLQCRLGPPSAVQAGAAWRVRGDASYSKATNYTRAITNEVLIDFKPIAGWNLPASANVTVVPGEIRVFDAFYTVITKTDQTITFGPLPAKTYGGAPFGLTATASSGLPVSYTSSDPTVASVAGSTVTILKAGSTTITASQAGDGNWNMAAALPQVLAIKKADPDVTAWPMASSITEGQTLASSTLTGGLAVPAGTFAFTTPSMTPNAGTAAQSVTFTPTDTTNYNPVVGSVNVTVSIVEVRIMANFALVGSVFSFSIDSVSGMTYTLEYTDSLGATGWLSRQTVAGTGGTLTLSDSMATAQARYYRVRIE
jgi:hypothetical protein